MQARGETSLLALELIRAPACFCHPSLSCACTWVYVHAGDPAMQAGGHTGYPRIQAQGETSLLVLELMLAPLCFCQPSLSCAYTWVYAYCGSTCKLSLTVKLSFYVVYTSVVMRIEIDKPPSHSW